MKPLPGAAAAILFLAACSPAAPARSADGAAWGGALGAGIADEWKGGDSRAFDFWIGEWDANWRPKAEDGFYHVEEGSRMRHRVFPILGGKAIVELAWPRDNPEAAGQHGFSIRYYDAANARWVMAQNWPNQNDPGSAFLDQLVGKEHLGRLTMYSAVERAQADGAMQKQHRRYNFTDIRPKKSFRWDGSNTPDAGKSWSTWYVVDFHYMREPDPLGAAGTAWPGVHEEKLCTEEPHGALDRLAGVWAGTATDGEGASAPAALTAGAVLDGCGVAAVLKANGHSVFAAFGYASQEARWVMFRLDDRPGAGHSYLVSPTAGEGAVFEQAPALAIRDEFSLYRTKEAFETSGALSRLVWESFSDDALVLRAEKRDSADGDWTLETEYRLTRE